MKNKIFIISIAIIILCANVVSASAESSDVLNRSLDDGKGIYNSSSLCVCADKFAGKDGKTYDLISADSQYCHYDGLDKRCDAADTEATIKKYVDAGIMDKGTAETFQQTAQIYRSSVVANLEQKTQVCNWAGQCTTKSLGNSALETAMINFNENAHWIYSFLLGIGLITSFFSFMVIFMKMSWLLDHPFERRKSIEQLLTSGISVVLLGGIWLFVSLFQSIFDRFWSINVIYSKDWKAIGNIVLYEYKGLIVGFLGIATLTVLIMFIKNFVQLSLHGANPAQRSQKMISLLFCAFAAAGLGGLTIFIGFFWNILR